MTLPSDMTLNRLTTEKERQDILARLMRLSIVIIFITSIPDVYFLIWKSIVVVVAALIAISIFYYFNKKGYTEFAGNALVVLISIILFIQSSQLGFESMVFLFYIPLIIGIPFVVDYNKKHIYWFHIVHPVLFIAILFATDFSLFKITSIAREIKLVAEFNIIGILIFCHYMLYLLIKATRRSERKYEAVVEDLNMQNSELQKINRELDRFVYSVSHDLRAPLASSLGLIELSKQEMSVEKMHYYNLLKERSLRRLDDYVNGLIDFSRNYRVQVASEEIYWKELIDQCIEFNKPYEELSGVHISTDINQEGIFISDSLRLKIILNNLISNSLKYYDDFKEWQILTIKVESNHKSATIEVRDNGVGIDEEVIDHVFEMFYRASERPKGSGLGLYITQETVDKLKGNIKVNSKMGEGTIFIVEIPNQADNKKAPH